MTIRENIDIAIPAGGGDRNYSFGAVLWVDTSNTANFYNSTNSALIVSLG